MNTSTLHQPASTKDEDSDESVSFFNAKIMRKNTFANLVELDEFEEAVQNRNQNLGNLDAIVARLIKKGRSTNGTQTDESLFINAGSLSN